MEPSLVKPMTNGENMPRRSIIPSLFALGKKHIASILSSVAKTEIFQVRLEREQKYIEYLGRIANRVDALNTAIKAFSLMKEKEEPTTINVHAVSEESINAILTQLQNAIAVLQGKDVVFPDTQKIEGKVEITNQKEFPKIQQIEGEVKVKNPVDLKPDLKAVVTALESVQETIQSIKIEVPKQAEIKIPEFPKQISVSESKDILRALQDLKKGIETLPKKFPEFDFPREVAISNFPPQHVPTPVTSVNINPLRGFVKSRNITVTSSLTPLPDEVLAFRRSIIVFNNDAAVTIFIGGSDVTSTNGLPVLAQAYSPVMDAGPKMILYGITASANVNVRVMELSNENIGG